ncbi:SDR family oxidoreductase [Actinomadura sp. NPDC048032]|uniref:SDR family NAD(P)-dependent oxidoreductase n=1 Tax=Actinomadura sp. NPDC048032 TaxID=3155747 RepID=UPI003409343B
MGGSSAPAADARSLDERIAVVTGGARGMGLAFVERLAARGARVVSIDRTHDPVPPAGGVGEADVWRVDCDLTVADEVEAVLERVAEAWGPVDVCVCNAGGGTGEMWENSPTRTGWPAFSGAYETNMATVVNICGPLAAGMAARGRGKIVTVSSVAALRPRADGGYAHYAAAKAAVIAYTRSLAREVAPYGVNANVMVPGAVGTERVLAKIRAVGMEEALSTIPLGRLCSPEECADVLEFLVTGPSDYLTGVVLPVDGGMSL